MVGEELGSPAYVAVGVLDAFATPFKPPGLPVHLFEGPLPRSGREAWCMNQAQQAGAIHA